MWISGAIEPRVADDPRVPSDLSVGDISLISAFPGVESEFCFSQLYTVEILHVVELFQKNGN